MTLNRLSALSAHITFREFPIYIRYLFDDEMFAILYFNNKAYFELGITGTKKLTPDFDDASWMNYPGIHYSVKIDNATALDTLFAHIRSAPYLKG